MRASCATSTVAHAPAKGATTRAEAEQQGATEKAGLSLLAQGKLDRGWLDANADALGTGAYRRFDRALSRPPAAATDPQTYGLLLLEASDDPQGALKGAFDAYREGRLDRTAFNKIHGAAMRAEQGDRPEWVGELRRDLLTRLQPGERQPGAEAVRQLDAGDAFEAWVAANPGATTEQARDAADALVDRYRGAAVKNERNELPLPRYVTEAREKVGVDTLRAAATRLKAAIDAGDLTEVEQAAEIENLRRWGDPAAPRYREVAMPDAYEEIDAIINTLPAPEPVAGALGRRFDATSREDDLRWLDGFITSGPNQPQAPQAAMPEQAGGSTPRIMIRPEGAKSLAGRVAADVARGATEAPRQILGGMRDAAQAAIDLGDWLADSLEEIAPLGGVRVFRRTGEFRARLRAGRRSEPCAG
ncbi:hypothetical protein ACFSKM_07770 [Ancylobacter dichloromethanicus]